MGTGSLIIIPARAGSKRVISKNTRLFKGKPLIFYSIRAAKLAVPSDKIVVSTDCNECIAISQNLGVRVHVRPAHLAGDKATTFDVIKNVCQNHISDVGITPDYVVLLQPTSPLRTRSLVEDGLSLLRENENADNVISLCDVTQFTGSIKEGYWTPDFPESTRSQDLPRKYSPTGNLFIYRYDTTIKQNRALGDNVLPYLEDSARVVNIDLEADFVRLEHVAQTYTEDFRYLWEN